MIGANCRIHAVLLACLLMAQVSTAGADNPTAAAKASQALVTVIHLAADGSDVMRGNGFLIGADGVLVTNFHLVTGAARLQVKLANGDVYDQVAVRGADPVSDLAVLKIPAFNAPHVTVGDALGEGKRPGSGQALHLICQSTGRDTEPVRAVTVKASFSSASGFEGFLFEPGLDAASKGCPVLDTEGRCLGVTTLALRPSAGTAGVAIGIGRLQAVLSHPMNRPLDLVDWSTWSTTLDASLTKELEAAGVKSTPPSAQIRTERNLRKRLELALEFDPTDTQARALLARACIQDRAYSEAASQIEKIVAQRSDWLEALTLRGDLLCHTGDYDGARKTYADIVLRGYQSPHNYSKERGGVRLHNVIHDHALDQCMGPLILTDTTLDFAPSWPNDRFSVEYARIRKVEVKLGQKPGEIRYELSFTFDGPIANESQTWTKGDIELRVPDMETGQNLTKYLRARSLNVQDKK